MKFQISNCKYQKSTENQLSKIKQKAKSMIGNWNLKIGICLRFSPDSYRDEIWNLIVLEL